ncbi:hypothetical protein MalM25_32820 [Planctomycetes bacterium MalM25]|nr:hypothetical protein MalM25_32820 [Planctomycetes bacterium MalM25]
MKRHLLLALAAALTLTTGVQASNLLNNAGFEDPLGFDFSDVTNWNGFFGGPPGAFLEAFNDTGAPAFAGAQALELTIEAGTFEGQPVNATNSFVGHTQSVPGVSEGDELVYSVWARNNASGLTGNVEFRIEYRDGGGGEISRDQILLDGGLTSEYQPFSVMGTAPAGTESVNVVMALATFNQDVPHSHSVLFDNASLTSSAIPEPTGLLLAGLTAVGVATARRQR